MNFDIPHNSLSRSKLTLEKTDIRNIHYGDILINYGVIVDCNKDSIPYIIKGAYSPSSPELLQEGDIVFADTAEDHTAGKAIEVYQIQESMVIAGLHTIVGRPQWTFSRFFLGYSLNSLVYCKQLKRLLQGSKVLSISKTMLADTRLIFPPSLAEQERIGEFFRSQDEGIAAVGAQIERLRAMKQACLERMFA